MPGDGPDVINIVEDYNRLDRFQQLGADLARCGWTSARLEKLFGMNLVRLYRDIRDEPISGSCAAGRKC